MDRQRFFLKVTAEGLALLESQGPGTIGSWTGFYYLGTKNIYLSLFAFRRDLKVEQIRYATHEVIENAIRSCRREQVGRTVLEVKVGRLIEDHRIPHLPRSRDKLMTLNELYREFLANLRI